MSHAERSAYHEARAWLDSRPNLELSPASQQTSALFPLERPAALVEQLGRPDQGYNIVLVAGTKGKGSTAVFIASMLRAHGLRVGLYSQPHLHSFRERLRIDGKLIRPAELAEELRSLRPTVEALDEARPEIGPLTAYEIATVLGLSWFARRNVDWAVLEVGLGGRWDATNIVTPVVAVITPISYDHTHILGKKLSEIAAEKAGIVKPEARIVSAPQRPSALRSIRRACQTQKAELSVVGSSQGTPRVFQVQPLRVSADAAALPAEPLLRFKVRGAVQRYAELGIYLGGEHQITNALTALAALEAIPAEKLRLDPGSVQAGLEAARWPGRLEVVRTDPLLVLDGAHNGDSAQRLLEALDLHFSFDRLHMLVGVFADKDLGAILRAMRAASSLTAVAIPSPRARPSGEVARAARRLGIPAHEGRDVGAALETVLAGAGRRDLICVTGSLTTVAAAREALRLAQPCSTDRP